MDQDQLRATLVALSAERCKRSAGAGESLTDVEALLARLADPLTAQQRAPVSSPHGCDSSEAATPVSSAAPSRLRAPP